VLQARLQITSALVSVLPLSVVLLYGYFNPFYLNNERRRVVLVTLAIIYPLSFFLINRSIPKLLRLRALKDGEQVLFPLEPVAKSGQKEASFVPEPLDHESDETQVSWVCPKCGEENPGNFDECWKCQTWRAKQSIDTQAKAP
jgi:ribosomal protein L40E